MMYLHYAFVFVLKVTVGEDFVALMSAVKGKEVINGDGTKTCHFEQQVCLNFE